MCFALMLYSATYMAIPVVLHGYADKPECERAATFIEHEQIEHSCVPERCQH